MKPILSAEHVTFRAGGKALLSDISLSVSRGERIAVIGPNGAGKTTLLRILSGELRPQKGRVTLNERNIASYAPSALALHRAVLSQNISVAFPFTVAEIVAMGARATPRAHIRSLVNAALRDVDLLPFAQRLITTLSGGEQQRAHFARVLLQLDSGKSASSAGILLLDEPTATLDVRHQLELLGVAKRVAASGTAVVAIVHDLNLAAVFADRIVVLHEGRIAHDGLPRETINEAVLRQVFTIENAANRVPTNDLPFVLPHAAGPAPLR